MRAKRMICLLALAAVCAFGGCRQRIVQEEAVATAAPARTEAPSLPEHESAPAEAPPTATPAPSAPPEPARETAPAERAPDISTQEVLDAEAAERAAADAETADDSAFLSGSAPGTDAADDAAATEDAPAPDSLTDTTPADTSGAANPSDKGGAVGVIIDTNAKFLRNGLGALYECEKGNIYFETADAYMTVSRASNLHTLILEAGGYNVAEKLQGETPIVADDWVIRKNPNVIVKCTNTLGAGVTDNAAALAELSALSSRSGWNGISAVANRTMLLLSADLFETDEGRLLAKLYIAEAMYPQLFAETGIDGIVQALAEAGGKPFTDGVYAVSTSDGL